MANGHRRRVQDAIYNRVLDSVLNAGAELLKRVWGWVFMGIVWATTAAAKVYEGAELSSTIVFACLAFAVALILAWAWVGLANTVRWRRGNKLALDFDQDIHTQPLGGNAKRFRVSVENKSDEILTGVSVRVKVFQSIDRDQFTEVRTAQFRETPLQPERPHDAPQGRITLRPYESQTFFLIDALSQERQFRMLGYDADTGAKAEFFTELTPHRMEVYVVADNSNRDTLDFIFNVDNAGLVTVA